MTASQHAGRTSEEKLLLFLGLFFVVGFVSFCLFEFPSHQGVFVKWGFVKNVPSTLVKVIGGTPNQAFLHSTDEKTFSCRVSENRQEPCIPDVWDDHGLTTEDCDPQGVPFQKMANPPQNISSCVQETQGGGGYTYTVIYALDRDHNLWQWVISDPGQMEVTILMFTVFGGFAGVLLGTVLWPITRLIPWRRAPAGISRFSILQIVILAIPWSCVLLWWITMYGIPAISSHLSDHKPIVYATEQAHSDETRTAEEAQMWLVEATPSRFHPRFDFTQGLCDARWMAGSDPVSCSASLNETGSKIHLLSNPSLEGNITQGTAIGIELTPEDDYYRGEYPPMEIKAGDHFRATIGCLDQAAISCEVSYDLNYVTEDFQKWRTGPLEAGQRWQVGTDRPGPYRVCRPKNPYDFDCVTRLCGSQICRKRVSRLASARDRPVDISSDDKTMDHSCAWLSLKNSISGPVAIEQTDGVWFLHHVLKADEKWVYDGEAAYVGEIIHDHFIPIHYCPYCGEKLSDKIENSHTDFHKSHAHLRKYPLLSSDPFYQCPEVEQLNASLQDSGIGDRWLVIQDLDGVWLLEKFTLATEEMVANQDVDNLDELYFLSGFDIIYCPFCGELLSPERIKSGSGGE